MFRSKNVTKILSILIAIVFWAYVMAIENPTMNQWITNVPVVIQNVSSLTQNGLALIEGENKTVEVNVRGTRTEIAKYKDQITAYANVFGYGAGEYNIAVGVSPLGGLIIGQIRPAQIHVKIENIVSVHMPVEISYSGELAPNTEPGSLTIQPEQIEVKGPQSYVEAVAYVGVELPLEQINRDGLALKLEVFAFDANGEKVDNVILSSNTVSISATLYDIKTVPLNVEIRGEVSEKYEVTSLEVPDSITIRGSRSSLLGISAVEAEPIDISGVEITSELPVKLILPAGVEPANNSYNIKVYITLKGIVRSSFEYNSQEILITGPEEGLSYYINTPSVVINMAGGEEALGSAVKGDFELSVDVSGLRQGVHLVAVIVTHNKELRSLEAEPHEVHITINEETNNEERDN